MAKLTSIKFDTEEFNKKVSRHFTFNLEWATLMTTLDNSLRFSYHNQSLYMKMDPIIV
jgi:hypothetical protein